MWKRYYENYSLFLPDFKETWIFCTDFRKKNLNIKLYRNSSSGSRVVPCGRTDTTKSLVAFRNFANAPKNKTPNASYLENGRETWIIHRCTTSKPTTNAATTILLLLLLLLWRLLAHVRLKKTTLSALNLWRVLMPAHHIFPQPNNVFSSPNHRCVSHVVPHPFPSTINCHISFTYVYLYISRVIQWLQWNYLVGLFCGLDYWWRETEK